MIGVRVRNGRPILDDRLPEPQPSPGEVLVRVCLAGVCGTDQAILAGYGRFEGILGHEFVGEAIASPDGSGWAGRRVVGRITIPCGRCPQCRENRPGHCAKRRVVGIRGADGVFAERVCIPAANLVAVQESVADEAAVFAEPLAAALRITEQVDLDPSHRILVIGAGTLGQLTARVLVRLGCQPTVVARHQHQQQRLAAAGISWIGEGEGEPRSYDRVVEASGSESGFVEALRMVRPEGCIVLKSSLKGKVPVDLSAVMINEVTVVGSRCGPMETAVGWLAGGKIDPTDLIDGRFPLYRAPDAFARASEPGALKVIIDC